MIIKGILDYDIVNYYKPSLFIAMPRCSFKCDKEFGNKICQNSFLSKKQDIEIDIISLVSIYQSSLLTKSIVIGGLEPFDNFQDLFDLIDCFRTHHLLKTDDDIVIYTGYKEDEISYEVKLISQFKNIIIKFGRYIPNSKPIYDNILKITLASSNQYAKIIS